MEISVIVIHYVTRHSRNAVPASGTSVKRADFVFKSWAAPGDSLDRIGLINEDNKGKS